MIEDKTRPQTPTPRDWAVFRYGTIGEATRPLADEVVSQVLARLAARQHQLPDGSLRRFSAATLRDAIATYGVPKRFYCDNGPAFSSQHLAEACARIGTALLHSEPFDPAAITPPSEALAASSPFRRHPEGRPLSHVMSGNSFAISYWKPRRLNALTSSVVSANHSPSCRFCAKRSTRAR